MKVHDVFHVSYLREAAYLSVPSPDAIVTAQGEEYKIKAIL